MVYAYGANRKANARICYRVIVDTNLFAQLYIVYICQLLSLVNVV